MPNERVIDLNDYTLAKLPLSDSTSEDAREVAAAAHTPSRSKSGS
jgi:hypothetical protein